MCDQTVSASKKELSLESRIGIRNIPNGEMIAPTCSKTSKAKSIKTLPGFEKKLPIFTVTESLSAISDSEKSLAKNTENSNTAKCKPPKASFSECKSSIFRIDSEKIPISVCTAVEPDLTKTTTLPVATSFTSFSTTECEVPTESTKPVAQTETMKLWSEVHSLELPQNTPTAVPVVDRDDLPSGWSMALVQRMTGATAGKYDIYYYRFVVWFLEKN